MDREKVIKAVEHCVLSDDCRVCEYWMKFDDTGCQIMKDALVLLKEQEPKPVGKEWNECPNCGKTLDRIHDMHYCGVCGQDVKWE